MSVFRETTIEWQGEVYKVTPSNRLLRAIESQGVSIAAMVVDFSNERPVWSCFALAAAELLKAGGAKITEDEVMAEIVEAQASGDYDDLLTFAQRVIEAIVPGVSDPKKGPPAKAGKGSRRGKK